MEFNRCRRCGVDRPVERFPRRGSSGPQAWCKDCRKVYDADYHRRTWEERRPRKKAAQQAFAAWCRSLKENTPCADCGAILPPEAMHWDHLPGTVKEANVSDLARRGSRRRFLEELAKCELVCANCHAARTVHRLGA